MTMAQAIENAMTAWFADGVADPVILNGESVNAHIMQNQLSQQPAVLKDVIEVEFRNADYAAIAYATDTLVVGGQTWRYPVQLRIDSYTKVVQFSKNQRPRV